MRLSRGTSRYYAFMVQQINRERRNAGVPEVTLGNNVVAQVHADSCLSVGTGSHWSSTGLKPYMRYSVAGGYQKNGENWFFQRYEGTAGISDILSEIVNAMKSLMNSLGHKQTILDVGYRKVNIGLAWNQHSFVAIQHFEGDFIEFQRLPSLVKGRLSFVGTVRNGVEFSSDDDLSVDVWFDPLPRQLTLGQLIRANAYDAGTIVASIRRPLPAGYFWSDGQGSTEIQRLPRPEDFAQNSPVPNSLQELTPILMKAYENNQLFRKKVVSYPVVTADYWRLGRESFFVSVDMNAVLDAHGPGMYSTILWAPVAEMDERVNICHYSVFVRDFHPSKSFRR